MEAESLRGHLEHIPEKLRMDYEKKLEERIRQTREEASCWDGEGNGARVAGGT